MKNALVPSSGSAIKDLAMDLSVTSALSLSADSETFRAKPDVIAIALAAQSAILVSFDKMSNFMKFPF